MRLENSAEMMVNRLGKLESRLEKKGCKMARKENTLERKESRRAMLESRLVKWGCTLVR